MDIPLKKTFLQQGSALYQEMIKLAPHDVIRRYLAFRIIVNAMCFEDVVGTRQNARMRQIRDVFLAHKQESDFFEGYRATDEVRDQTISPLLKYIATETGTLDPKGLLPELIGGASKAKFEMLIPLVFAKFEKDFIAGNRVVNNFMCFTGNSIHEVSTGDLPGAFYRYNSSKGLYDLAEYVFNNARKDPDLVWLTRHAKLDMLLHAQNMADCAIKDTRNPYSIDGIKEVISSTGIGNSLALQALANDPAYRALYDSVRKVRNKLVGHMDTKTAMALLISTLDALPDSSPSKLFNLVENAVRSAASTHPSIMMRCATTNYLIDDPSIINIAGTPTQPYF
jgi:hypothetical protein